MARIIRLHDDNHEELERLLPWYVTGRLEPAEHARVEAHLAQCEECQEDVRFERALARHVKDLPLDTDVGWRRMERRLEDEPPRRRSGLTRAGLAWGGWAAAACALVAVGVMALPHGAPPRYHVLGAPAAGAQGDMVVIFRPETMERDIRAELKAVGARIVDGPTSADAYVLQVAPAARSGALARLRSQANIVLAEPVDPGAAP